MNLGSILHTMSLTQEEEIDSNVLVEADWTALEGGTFCDVPDDTLNTFRGISA